MSNKERIDELDGWAYEAELRLDNIIDRIKALESAVTLTDMGWATAEPEPEPCLSFDIDGAERPTHNLCWLGKGHDGDHCSGEFSWPVRPTPEPSLPSPWQPMETCEKWHEDWRWFATTDGLTIKMLGTVRERDEHYGRIAWCPACDDPEPPPHPDVLGKVDASEDSCPIGVHSPGEPHVRTWADTCVNCGTGLAPLPAPPTELTCGLCGELPKGSASINDVPYCHGDEDALSCYMWAQADANPAPPTEPAPEPSPDKAERYTAERTYHGEYVLTFGDDQGGRLVATFENLIDAERIAAALNSTPDPLLVGLVDEAVKWRRNDTTARRLVAVIDAYLAGEGDEG